MTRDVVSLEELEAARVRLLDDIRARLTGNAATFLLSLHDAEPDFGLIGLPDAERLPAAQWKLLNLRKLDRKSPRLNSSPLMRILYAVFRLKKQPFRYPILQHTAFTIL